MGRRRKMLVADLLCGAGGSSTGCARALAAHRGEQALVAPFLVLRYGERPGQEPRTRTVEAPSPAVVPTTNGGSLAAVHLAYAQHGGAVRDAAVRGRGVTA